LGTHKGGYTPFEFELTKHARWGQDQRLVLRVDDRPHPFKLEGKQGYGPAKGIWQTVYIEARAPLFIQNLHFVPDWTVTGSGVLEHSFGKAAACGQEIGLG
jgi:hypothetical protein